jgi:DNA-3-methyladenine glycosylase II
MIATETIILKCVPPFNFDLTASLFSNGDSQIRRFDEGKFWQVLRADNQLILATLESSGTTERPEISGKLRSNRKISQKSKEQIQKELHRLFDTQFDPEPFYKQASSDEVLKRITQKLTGLRIPSTPTVFEALIDSIVEQQISLDIAHTFETRVIRTFGDKLNLDDETYYAYPTPKNLATATLETLRNCGLSVRKSEYVTNIAKLVAEKELDLEVLRNYDDVPKIIEKLDAVRGIGAWTAELTIARSMHKYDVIPYDDLGLRRVISHYYRNDKKITAEEARTIAEKWGEWKGLAGFYLIVAETVERPR